MEARAMLQPMFIKVGHDFNSVNAVAHVAIRREGMPDEHCGATVYTIDGKTFEAEGDEAEIIFRFVSSLKANHLFAVR
jgi:hypothetical protein